MPRLLIFAPCEMLVVGQDNTVSLVRLLSDITLTNIPNIVPEGTAVPFRWFIFAEWSMSDEDRQQHWEQKVTLLNARNEDKFSNTAEFDPQNQSEKHRMIAVLGFIPILAAGDYRLQIAFREIGSADWVEAHFYPIKVIRQ
jgi:hypothetical protein